MRFRSLYLVALLVGFVGISVPALRAEIIISEIMYNPQGTDLDTTVTPNIMREWAELYNTGTATVDLSGWQFGDSQDNTWASAFPTGTTIGPSEALVVTGDSTSFDKEWGVGIHRIAVGAFPTLANSPSPTNETAAIRDSTGTIRDLVNFDDGNGWPRTNGSDGQSIFLLPQALSTTANNIGTNWRPSVRALYGAVFKSADGENHGSPGFVDTVPQTPFTPSSDAAWSMVVMPDTQNYVKSTANNPILSQLTNWIKDNRDAFKIQVVLQEGDIVNNNNNGGATSTNLASPEQWQNAKDGFAVLNGYVPYIMSAGNHDFGFTNADNRDTMINSYFHPSDNPLTDPANGGILKGEMTAGDISNAYYALTAPDGRKMLIFSLEWEPRPAVVTWANQIAGLPEYADHTAVLLTHNYLQSDSTRSTSTNVAADASGEDLWQELIKPNSNFQIVFNGHFGGDGEGKLSSTDNAGRSVEQMFFNTQFESFGGDGWIRIVEFLQDGKTVRVRTYSPFLGLYRTGSAYDFEFQLQGVPSLQGDYNGNGVVDAGDYVLWRKQTGMSGSNLSADGTGDHVVNQLDLLYWRIRFGNSLAGAGASLASVPEPSAGLLLLIAAFTFSALRKPRCLPLAI